MKILQILSVCLLTTLSLFSCKQANENVPPKAETEIEPIKFSSNILSFASENEFANTLMDLMTMLPNEREQWYAKQVGFMSQDQAATLVSQQLMRCKSLEEAIALRDSYDQFVFNKDIAESDFTPYPKVGKLGHSMLANAYGDVTIAGQIVNLNDIETYQNTWVGRLEQQNRTKAQESTVNWLHMWTDERKVWAEAYVASMLDVYGNPIRKLLVVKANTQQKVCFIFCAWHTYINEFIFRNPYHYFMVATGFKPTTGRLSNLYATSQGEVVIRAGDSNMIVVGDVTIGIISTALSIHTQGVGADNAGILKIENPPHTIFNHR